MTSNVKAHPGKNMRGAPEPPDVLLPPLDRAEASVNDLLRNAKKRGYVTVEQVSSALTRAGLTPETTLATLPEARSRVFARHYKKHPSRRKAPRRRPRRHREG